MYYFLYSILIILTIYSDSPLQLQLNYFGRTFIPVIAYPLYIIMSINKSLPRGDIFLDKYGKLLRYTIGISIFALLVCWIGGFGMNHLGEFLPAKMIKMIFIYFSYWVYLKLLINLSAHLSFKQVCIPFLYGLVLITIIAYIEYYIGEFIFNPIHFGDASFMEWDYNRVRLLCSESSFTVPLIEIFLGVSLYYSHFISKSFISRIVTYSCGFLLLYTTGSKTLMIAIFIAVFYSFYVTNNGRLNVTRIISIIIILSIACMCFIYIMPILQNKLFYDIEENTSTVTRTYTVLMGYFVGIFSIVGTGFQSYVVFYPQLLKDFLGLIDLYMPNANLSEITSYINTTNGQNISAKSFFAQVSMFWGICGTIYLIKSYLNVFHSLKFEKSIEKIILGSVTFVILFQLLFTADMDYIVLALVAFQINLRWHKRNNTKRNLI